MNFHFSVINYRIINRNRELEALRENEIMKILLKADINLYHD